MAAVLENEGVSAYDGAITAFAYVFLLNPCHSHSFISSADLRTAAATVATVEARHASYLNLLNNARPFPDKFDPVKSYDEVVMDIGPFLGDGCPAFARFYNVIITESNAAPTPIVSLWVVSLGALFLVFFV